MGTTASAPAREAAYDRSSSEESDASELEETMSMPPFLGSVQDMVDSVKSEQDAARLTTLVRQAAERRADLFHYAAAVGDQAFFSIIMAFLPTPVFAREMRRRNANGRRPLECCEHMHPTLASALKTFFIKNGVDLDNNVNANVSTAARAQARRIVKLDEIVGMEKPRERILQAIRLSETTPDVPVKPVLLEGPPGTGKSFLAMCIAAELGLEIVEIKTHDVLNHRLGGTESQVRAYFERAARVTPLPALVVINEFESMCPKLKDSSESWHSTLRQCFLTLFDDTIDPASKFWGVRVVLTTNFVDNVDSAALSRMERIHIPLPSASDLMLLFPKICRDRVPHLDVELIDWESVASVGHELLSVRGVQDVIASVARKLLAAGTAATSSDFEEAVYDVVGDVPPEPLKRTDKFSRVSIPPKLVLSTDLASCIARCGWRFSSAPTAVYRQVFTLEEVNSTSTFILREMETDSYFSGRGCHRALINPSADQKRWKPFDKYEVFVQCAASDGDQPVPAETTSVYIESSGNVGAQRLEWTDADVHLAVYPRGAWYSSISACLAPRMKLFEAGRVFVESKADSVLRNVDSNAVLVIRSDDNSYLVGDDAVLVAGGVTLATLNGLGYRVFLAAKAQTQLLPPHVAVAYFSHPAVLGDNNLKQLVIGKNRFVVCPNTATTVGSTLRANSIFYAALDAVYVRQTQFEATDIASLRKHGHNLLAVPADGPTSVWSGCSIADFACEASFLAMFDVYTPCTGPSQALAAGATLMVDVRALSRPLSAGKKFAILRYYPSAQMVSQELTTHHGAAIGESGARVRDKGYNDDSFLKGFRKGWYEDVYWRMVGDSPNTFLSGGVDGNDYKFNIRQEHGFGFDNRRIMIKLPVHGVVFCRGVGDDASNPTMACVLFNPVDGKLWNTEAHMYQLGRWNDIVQ
ncbi:hypothetical protein PF010_g4246 [Phytophthora fragariae]|uniref:AAA+ ATPase domain-containing protein n=1 Tax=Phytophthora fragariae TaxID=53985 RepID=A0A6G0PPN6_9STRA|nr:hypothetical protein PF010_g4246 [Phytophthora fragariae]KAE9251557.1 hypothetical protein PF004_g2411 [Phytophthora fragariae]